MIVDKNDIDVDGPGGRWTQRRFAHRRYRSSQTREISFWQEEQTMSVRHDMHGDGLMQHA